jgi:hypothetical protein
MELTVSKEGTCDTIEEHEEPAASAYNSCNFNNFNEPFHSLARFAADALQSLCTLRCLHGPRIDYFLRHLAISTLDFLTMPHSHSRCTHLPELRRQIYWTALYPSLPLRRPQTSHKETQVEALPGQVVHSVMDAPSAIHFPLYFRARRSGTAKVEG